MPNPGSTNRRKTSLPKLIEKYYADLADVARQNVFVEMGTRTAFFALLHTAGKEHGWTLIAEQEKKVGGKTIRPDGTFKDEMNLVRGYWEAKDTADKLDAEIEKKRKAGYPLNNIIFEDTRQAVLYQNGTERNRFDLTKPQELVDLLKRRNCQVRRLHDTQPRELRLVEVRVQCNCRALTMRSAIQVDDDDLQSIVHRRSARGHPSGRVIRQTPRHEQ
jgi:hypothetical protein